MDMAHIEQYLTHYAYLGDESVNDIRVDVKSRMGSNKFKSNPSQYMLKWKEKRGYTEEYRIIEDSSYDIISKLLRL